MLKIHPLRASKEKDAICEKFINCSTLPRFVLGKNEYAKSIAESINIDGFIDDFSSDTSFLGKPIVKTENTPLNSLVISTSVLRPITALEKLKSKNKPCVDYFYFQKYAKINVPSVGFWNEFKLDLKINWSKYQNVYNALEDKLSKKIFSNIINFRYSADLEYMKEFRYAIEEQYFENFLDLKSAGEVFADVGCFDGQTSIEFIKRCPQFKAIHAFEPDINNLSIARKNLAKHANIAFYQIGLADSQKTIRFNAGGDSASKIANNGSTKISVDSMDNIIHEAVSFIKMDIEGAESLALQGAQRHIKNDFPKLAICVYHRFDDLWKIPEQILAMRQDYSIYLRHYTEGIDETVMFFIPKTQN